MSNPRNPHGREVERPYHGRYDKDASCACVSEHRPPVLTYQWHHIRPKAMGGEDTKYGVLGRNGIWLCSTTHDSTHEILRLFLPGRPVLTYHETKLALPRPVSRYAWETAVEGWRRWVNDEWGEAA